MEMAKVTSKGQITIPVSIRRRLEIDEGTKLLFIDSPDGVVMVNPKLLQGGEHDIEEYQSSIEKTVESPKGQVKQKIKEAKSEVSSDESNISASTPVGVMTGTAPTETGKPSPQVKGVDIGALLDEIRSIGSKI